MNRGIDPPIRAVNRLFYGNLEPPATRAYAFGAAAGLQVQATRLNLDTLRREMVWPVALTSSGAAEPRRGFSQDPARHSLRHHLLRAIE